MDVFECMEPFTLVFDWMRSQPITLFGVTFTYMDAFVWSLIATVAVWFINKLND